MDTTIETDDLKRFRPQELLHAAEVLNAYAKQGASWLQSEVTLCLNESNRNVYLVDTREEAAMLDKRGRLRKWYLCTACNHDGFDGDTYTHNKKRMRREFVKFDGFCSARCRDSFT